MQDDNRGLSQGVTDNLLTYHQFTLILEKKKDSCAFPVPPIEHLSGLLSVGAHIAMDDLLHPIIAEHPKNLPFELNASFSPAGFNLPIDLSVVSFRVIPIPEGAGNGIGIVLHRQALNLCWGDSSVLQRFPVSKTGEIDLSKFFINMQDWTISDTPLTFNTVGQSRRSSKINLCPNQILSLLFHKTES